MSDRPSVAIIIAVKEDNANLRESMAHCLALDEPADEIIVLPDVAFDAPEGVTVIPTGPCGPAEKRDLGAERGTSDVLAFLDDDAYPVPDWLTHARDLLTDPSVGGVGGPGVTPDSDPFTAQVSGDIYNSPLVSGPHVRRYLPREACDVDDWPSCNLLVRRDAFLEVGGFDSAYWPGEDTVLCLKITRDLNLRLVYGPRALVYHHRRPSLRRHLRQAAEYGLHRGHFVKRFPETSRRPTYFAPSVLTAFVAIGWIPGLFLRTYRRAFGTLAAVYVLAVLIATPFRGQPLRYLYASLGTGLTHLAYGSWFLRGLSTRDIEVPAHRTPRRENGDGDP